MGKRFVTRTHAEWEMLAGREIQETRGLQARATVWLQEMLQRFDHVGPSRPLTLAVPDRFWEALGPDAVSRTSVEKFQATSKR